MRATIAGTPRRMLGTSPSGQPKLTNPAGLWTWMSRRYGAAPGALFEIFVSGPEIRMRPEIFVLVVRRRRVAVAPAQDVTREIGQLRAGLRIDEIPGAGDREVETVILAGGPRRNRAVFRRRALPGRREVQAEIREAHDPLDRVGGRGRAGAAEADRLVPADIVGQVAVIVVRAGIALDPRDRHRGEARPACEQVHRRGPFLQRHSRGVEGRCGAADHRYPLAAQRREIDRIGSMRV